MPNYYHSQFFLYLDKLLDPWFDLPNQFFRFSIDLILSFNRLHVQSILFIQPEVYKHVEKRLFMIGHQYALVLSSSQRIASLNVSFTAHEYFYETI